VNIMLDLETMGNGPNAAIVAIGAVEFKPADMTLGQEYYHIINLESSVKAGGQMDASTVMWWMRQGEEARGKVCGVGMSIHIALSAFAFWLSEQSEPVLIWGNGSDFDNVILAQAYRRADMSVPWKYSSNRCYRTMKALRPDVPLLRAGTHHDALDDAKAQALHLMTILRVLDGKPHE
jgi:hypothetical protein